jgi:cellulose biosynthesis protein BcsQ
VKILAIISHKGGAGKTTSAVCIAQEFARKGTRVLLVDADRQSAAGVLLDLRRRSEDVLRTRFVRLHYLMGTGIRHRELPGRIADLTPDYDLAVVDTPSLDDPVARWWIEQATHILQVMPVEPVSLRTIDGLGAIADRVLRLNPNACQLGTLPTMLDEANPVQRELMLELLTREAQQLLPIAIPQDASLAHGAEERIERRTQPAAATLSAYACAAEHLRTRMLEEMPAVAPAAPPAEAISATAAWPQLSPPAAGVPRRAGLRAVLSPRRLCYLVCALLLVAALGVKTLSSAEPDSSAGTLPAVREVRSR